MKKIDASEAEFRKVLTADAKNADAMNYLGYMMADRNMRLPEAKQLIEKGYLFIAQPPLYKAKIGKLSQYLKDDSQLRAFLFDWAMSSVDFVSKKDSYSPEEFKKMLDLVLAYENKIHEISLQFLAFTNEDCANFDPLRFHVRDDLQSIFKLKLT